VRLIFSALMLGLLLAALGRRASRLPVLTRRKIPPGR
jgi:hypothetical protein